MKDCIRLLQKEVGKAPLIYILKVQSTEGWKFSWENISMIQINGSFKKIMKYSIYVKEMWQ